jgi:DNA (cytosine-5)-methyltransferase 1
MTRPLLLDLCCGEGGSAAGYIRAGFDVLGIDTRDCRDRYPGRFERMDALDALDLYQRDVDAIHTSPPCQRWTHGNVANDVARYPDLITAHRAALVEIGKPYVIENVPRAPLRSPLTLCGTMFGLTATDVDGVLLYLRRHRQFESSEKLEAPGKCAHLPGVQWAGAYGGARRDKEQARHVRHGGYVPSYAVLCRLLDVGWMTERGLFQAIPPAYTEWLGTQLLRRVR